MKRRIAVEVMQSFQNKASFRKQALSIRDSLAESVRSSASKIICDRLKELIDRFDELYAYMPFRSEVDIKPLIGYAYEARKKVFLPSVLSKSEIVFRHFKGFEKLVVGAFGIMEAEEQEEEDMAFIRGSSIILIPGVAFGKDFSRMGYGAGYYDRFLGKREESCFKVGVAFSCQLYESVPHDEHDVMLDAVITEENFFKG